MKTKNINEIKKWSENYDTLICCSSFEDRSLILPINIDRNFVKNVILCYFNPISKKAKENLNKIKNQFDSTFKEIVLLKNDPISNYDMLLSLIEKVSPKKVLFDISTFTRENIFVGLQVLLNKKVKFSISYVPSSNYKPDKNNKIWLSRGVNEIRSVLGYAGFLSPLKKTLLIILTGFEAERAQIIVDAIEPSKLVLGMATQKNSVSSEIFNVNESNFKLLLNLNADAEKFSFSCIDLDTTKNELEKIVSMFEEEYNIIISPLSNKISTLAVAAIANKHPNIQICYASANQYNTEFYSTPSETFTIIEKDELFI